MNHRGPSRLAAAASVGCEESIKVIAGEQQPAAVLEAVMRQSANSGRPKNPRLATPQISGRLIGR
jgi:hypothetical protein